VRLGVAAVGEANTLRALGAAPQPRFKAAAIDAASGAVRPAVFEAVLLRPFALERGACMWQRTPPVLPLVYDGAASDALRAPPLSPDWGLSAFDCAYFLSLSDAAFLEKMSTSPDAEAPDFVPFLRAVLGFVHERVSALERGSGGGGGGGARRGGGKGAGPG